VTANDWFKLEDCIQTICDENLYAGYIQFIPPTLVRLYWERMFTHASGPTRHRALLTAFATSFVNHTNLRIDKANRSLKTSAKPRSLPHRETSLNLSILYLIIFRNISILIFFVSSLCSPPLVIHRFVGQSLESLVCPFLTSVGELSFYDH